MGDSPGLANIKHAVIVAEFKVGLPLAGPTVKAAVGGVLVNATLRVARGGVLADTTLSM